MSKADVARFVNDVQTNTNLQIELTNRVGISDLVAVAKKHGYDVTEQDAREYAEQQKALLTESELEGVAGGGGFRAVDAAKLSDAKLAVYTPPPPPKFVGIVIL